MLPLKVSFFISISQYPGQVIVHLGSEVVVNCLHVQWLEEQTVMFFLILFELFVGVVVQALLNVRVIDESEQGFSMLVVELKLIFIFQ